MNGSLRQVYTNIANPLAKLVKRKMNYSHPQVVQFARQLASKAPGPYNISQICYIHDYLRRNWKYVNDPAGTEYIAFASESINNGLNGDCDDFAITMASIIAAIGGTTRVIFAWSPIEGHAYAEVYVAKTQREIKKICEGVNKHYRNIAENWLNNELAHMFADEKEEKEYNKIPHPWNNIDDIKDFFDKHHSIRINYHIDKNNRYWLNLDWSSKYPGGPIYEAKNGIIIYPNGQYIITNFRFNTIGE